MTSSRRPFENSNQTFNLSVFGMLELKKSGISDSLIKVMLEPRVRW
jgi:hypothetical protein